MEKRMSQKARRKSKVWVGIGVLVMIIGAGVIWMNLSWSPLKSEFFKYFYQTLPEKDSQNRRKEILTKEEISHLPACVQKFYEVIGLVDKEKYDSLCMYSYDTDFVNKSKKMKIDYFEYIFGPEPVRLAFIDSKIAGIPFQGLDSFLNGKGGMKGVIGKCIKVFDIRNQKMDQAAFATWLAEAILIPNSLLENDMIWEEITSTHVKVTFRYQSMTASAEYKFNEAGELIEVYCLGRGMTLDDGTIKEYPWSIYFDRYKQSGDYYLPAIVQVAWHVDDHIEIYYDAKDSQFQFGVTKPFGKE